MKVKQIFPVEGALKASWGRIRAMRITSICARLLLLSAAAIAWGSAGIGCGGGGEDCVHACQARCEDEAKNNCPPGRICFCNSTPCFKSCGY